MSEGAAEGAGSIVGKSGLLKKKKWVNERAIIRDWKETHLALVFLPSSLRSNSILPTATSQVSRTSLFSSCMYFLKIGRDSSAPIAPRASAAS